MPAARWLISGWNLIDSGEQVGVHAEAVAEIRVAGDLLICEIRGFSLDFSSDYFAVADAEDVDFGRFSSSGKTLVPGSRNASGCCPERHSALGVVSTASVTSGMGFSASVTGSALRVCSLIFCNAHFWPVK